ncbi:MAG: hypothetical protein M0P69_07385 [Bacteroidales bacterium]|jgi:hypothetical protein|nr:hypothetical protein [Bacteroidales bacterium]
MLIFGIDPGPIMTAFVLYDGNKHLLISFGKVHNKVLLKIINKVENPQDIHFCIEMIKSMGMPVGDTVFQTCVFIGRIVENIIRLGGTYSTLGRKDIVLEICGTPRAKDANVRAALLDLWPPTGGGKVPQVGTKNMPGPLFGVSKDVWSALAVAVTKARKMKYEKMKGE